MRENVIPPTKELREKMERLKREPPPSPEKMEAQLRSCKKLHQSKEYQDQERFVRRNWKQLAEAWNKLPGRSDENCSEVSYGDRRKT